MKKLRNLCTHINVPKDHQCIIHPQELMHQPRTSITLTQLRLHSKRNECHYNTQSGMDTCLSYVSTPLPGRPPESHNWELLNRPIVLSRRWL
ncbi:hypothetical protein CEXT_498921 [Caerostris extrusa]|uniref:Uncharacterized protein n=1 Tax=Caerostris extrusa TaxID=172846 RepID=A0AAV4Y2F6_CAEEX|nr:hypothetical protein CEXT_498921 [Caerostris extrusa]